MPEFSLITGRLVEVHRFINVPMRWSEQYPARERREIWIAQPDGSERKLIVHSRVMPARHGHMIKVLTWGQKVLALSNQTTGDQVCFVEVDPPLLWGRSDAARTLSAIVLLCAGVLQWSEAAWLLLVLPAVALLASALIGLRWVGRSNLQSRSRTWLADSGHMTQERHLVRVK